MKNRSREIKGIFKKRRRTPRRASKKDQLFAQACIAQNNEFIKVRVKIYVEKILVWRISFLALRGKKIVGKCPVCGKAVIKNKSNNYVCSGKKEGCRFVIWGTISQKKLPESLVETLLIKKKTKLIKGFTSKSGKRFDARLIIENGKVTLDFAK